MYHTKSEHANNYTSDVVSKKCDAIISNNVELFVSTIISNNVELFFSDFQPLFIQFI